MELKTIRKCMGLTQIEVAKRLNMPQQTYSRYENGVMDPSTSTLIKLADFFNVSVDEILGRESLFSSELRTERLYVKTAKLYEDFNKSFKELAVSLEKCSALNKEKFEIIERLLKNE